ncbi:hypothetical protein LTR36_004519 [Oleoguttula mirabilis]|uniref:Uncharacterized protein n=1 Tax=Oleoguttula mirabilis TaxID=1507867 RepID=A0AAV9JFP8_9PEZI|nr:hypothetical protein LTR36_004519 [Oleoguttula mirabilis]
MEEELPLGTWRPRDVRDRTQSGGVDDRLRIWEVRKYCQLKPTLASGPIKGSPSASTDCASEHGEADYALAALLRCLIYELHADLAMVSLLDETTQHFLSGAARSQTHFAKATLESTKWYGCDMIQHAGGLCPRTILITGDMKPTVYEELDLTQPEYTKNLPVVNGEIARLRYYAGAPIKTVDGRNIGTVFLFREQPASECMNAIEAAFLTETARQVMRQLEQSLRALEGKRSAMFNDAFASLTRGQQSKMPELKRSLSSREAEAFVSDIYKNAADLLMTSCELDGVFFQQVPARMHSVLPKSTDGSRRITTILAQATKSGVSASEGCPRGLLTDLLKGWPDGETFHRTLTTANQSWLAGSGSSVLGEGNVIPCQALAEAFPEASQLLIMPIWDSVHERVVAIAVGWALGWSRVYTTSSDLGPMSAFCQAVITQVRRFEAQHMDRKKSDFLGSISHEMRSPLHGTLANLELLLGTECTAEQRDMVDGAIGSGRQLLDTIDQILEYSQISSVDTGRPPLTRSGSVSSQQSARSTSGEPARADFLRLAEELVEHVVYRSSAHEYESLQGGPMPAGTGYLGPPIVLDTCAMSSAVLGHPAAFRTSLINLMSNAIKYTMRGCIRVSVEVQASSTSSEGNNLIIVVADCGKGMSGDYLANHLFVPFAQGDHLEPGTGLGLPLLKRTAESIGGSVLVESDESEGTTVKVSLPVYMHQLDGNSQNHVSERMSELSVQDGDQPILRAQLYSCVQHSKERRDVRSREMLQSSLEKSLRRVGTQLEPWNPTSPPDMVIISHDDVHEVESWIGEREGLRWLILSRNAKPPSLPNLGSATRPMFATLTGPILPSKLQSAVKGLFPDKFDAAGNHFPVRDPLAASDGPTALIAVDNLSDVRNADEKLNGADEQLPKVEQPAVETEDATTDVATNKPSCETAKLPPKPNMLLVDDNAINLKVLSLYARKCGVINTTSVRDGKEAVDAFQNALENTPFDVILMDLSMPVMTGFEATAAIRAIERESNGNQDHQPRASFIAALTSLVSAKDRNAAYEAGVDQYITKPAGVKHVRDVIDAWVRARAPTAEAEDVSAVAQSKMTNYD